MERFAKIVVQGINDLKIEPNGRPVSLEELETPPDPTLGDFALPCFKASKTLRKSPNQIAQEWAKLFESRPFQNPEIRVQAVGPYLNFTVAPETACRLLLQDILSGAQGTYGQWSGASRGTWVLEYSSPNVAKQLNVYHLRPTAMGAALDRIGRYRGFNVISMNHLGDWGKQYGMLAVAFRRYGKDPSTVLSMSELVELYVRINADAQDDPSIEEQAREAFLQLERGAPEITSVWKKCVEISLIEFNRIYARLGVHFDHIWGESHYQNQLEPLVQDLKKRGLLVESEGAWVVPVQDEKGKELPPCLLIKRDGATIYATRDLAAAIYRHEQFHFDRMTYIVGAEQKLHFQQVFGVLRKMGFEWVSRCEHIAFGLYRFKDAKMSTRKGNFITLEAVLELIEERVRTLLASRESSSEGMDIDATAEAVTLGAAIFYDLSTDPTRDVELDLDRMVDFEGETGPYLQYTHTRCLSLLRKAQATNATLIPRFEESLCQELKTEPEIQLVKKLGQFPLELERTLTLAKPSQLTSYLLDVAKLYNHFYRECRVLGESAQLTRARLLLVESTRRILGRGLSLLGIPLPERM